MTGRLTPQDKALRAISEATWQRTVLDILAAYCWATYAPPIPGRRADGSIRNTTPGWPDVCAVRGDRMLCLELKREQGKTTSAQEAWIADLSAVPGVTALVLRPSDRELLLELAR